MLNAEFTSPSNCGIRPKIGASKIVNGDTALAGKYLYRKFGELLRALFLIKHTSTLKIPKVRTIRSKTKTSIQMHYKLRGLGLEYINELPRSTLLWWNINLR